MDIPVMLEDEGFVDGLQEARQSLVLLFENETKSWNLHALVGSVAPIHTNLSPVAVDSYIQYVVSQVDGCELVSTSSKQVTRADGVVVLEIECVITYNNKRYLLTYDDDNGWR